MSAARLVEWPLRSSSSRWLAPASATGWLPVLAQVMQMNVKSGRGERGMPGAAAGVGVLQRLAVRAGEYQRLSVGQGESVQVHADIRHDHGGHRDGALASVGFGRSQVWRAIGHLAKLPGDADSPVLAVDVGALESGQLSPAQPAEAGGQDQRPVAPVDRIGQGVDLADGQERSLW